MTTVEILREARALIDTPEKWAKGFYAYDANGATVDADSPDACRFCALGAIYHVVRWECETQDAVHALAQAVPENARESASAEGSQFVPHFNDDVATHADILALFDRAIEAES